MTGERFTLLHAPLPAWLELRLLVVGPGAERRYVAEDWRDAIAVLEQSSIMLEHATGARLRLGQGTVFSLAHMTLVAIRNHGPDAAVIALGTRRGVPS